MRIFSVIGHLFISLFNALGNLILNIAELPRLLRNIDTEKLKDKVSKSSEKIKNIKIKENIQSNQKSHNTTPEAVVEAYPANIKNDNLDLFEYESKEKESVILRLQILSLTFLGLSILYIFNYIPFLIYLLLGVVIIALIIYLLFKRVKLMYKHDFKAYQNFFLMYIAAGILLVIIGTNPLFLALSPFEFLPSLSVFILAIILVIGIMIIFRLLYNRDFTYGLVIETGKKMAYVRVDYDIRSNVKPDIYIVENLINAAEGEIVKLQIEKKLFSTSGNKPIRIIDHLH